MAEAKQKYDDIAIPKELSERVGMELERGEKKHNMKMAEKKKVSVMRKRTVAAAAAVAVLFGAGVNTSETFAREMYNVPVIGALARVFTVRSYDTDTEDLKISVEIPSIEMIAEGLKGMERPVNEDIHAFCEQYAREAETRADEYRQAFLDTGGTKEEWAEHNISIRVWYEVKTQTDRYLSIAVTGTESWSSAYGETRFYNFDMEAGKWVTLCDLLGEDYARIADQSILDQIQAAEEEGAEFWTQNWEGVDSHTKFYISRSGNPVVVLDKYEIAPGAAGQLEFEIGRTGGDAAVAQKEDGVGENLETQDGYEDNFAVDTEAVADYAGRIKEAVAEKDIEKLADLTAFPVYVGLAGENPVVETREALTAMGEERIFTDEMVNSIERADESGLSPSMAGFTLYGGEGMPSITFGVRDGRLAITGMNY